LHPVKLQPAAGVAVSATWAPLGKFAPQLPPQSIPAGALVTVPLPVSPTESGKLFCVKLADTFCAAFIVTLQLPAPAQTPPHPVKLQPAAGAAVSATCVPPAKFALQ